MIEDLFDLRRDKLMRIMKRIDADTPVMWLSSAGAAELNYCRPAFVQAHSLVNRMQNVLEENQTRNWKQKTMYTNLNKNG